MAKQGNDTIKIDGFTPDQRFFLGYAQVWRQKLKDANRLARIQTDTDSPEMFRVNGPLVNFSPFYTTFGVLETNKMYVKPEARAKIW